MGHERQVRPYKNECLKIIENLPAVGMEKTVAIHSHLFTFTILLFVHVAREKKVPTLLFFTVEEKGRKRQHVINSTGFYPVCFEIYASYFFFPFLQHTVNSIRTYCVVCMCINNRTTKMTNISE